MKVQAVTIDLEAFGAQFANMGSDDQSLFFKGLAAELALWPSQHQAQMQFAYAGRDLKQEEKDLLENALGMLWCKDQS